jgi:hypothetical protein
MNIRVERLTVGLLGNLCRLTFQISRRVGPQRLRDLGKGNQNLNGIERDRDTTVLSALNKTQLFKPRCIGVNVRVVALRRLGKSIDTTRPSPA